jgi:hypothetical protein
LEDVTTFERPASDDAGRRAESSDVDPSAPAPIPTARVLAPAIVVAMTPSPSIWVYVYAQVCGVVDVMANVPAIAVVIAYDFG